MLYVLQVSYRILSWEGGGGGGGAVTCASLKHKLLGACPPPPHRKPLILRLSLKPFWGHIYAPKITVLIFAVDDSLV